MKLNTRFALLLGFLLTALVLGVVVLNAVHERQTRESITLLQRDQASQLDKLLMLTAYPLQQFTRDYSMWDDMVAYIREPNDDWAKINLEASLDTFRLQGIWVISLDGKTIYANRRSPIATNFTPIGEKEVQLLRGNPYAHFFVRNGDELLEFQAAPIQPSNDLTRSTPAQGYLVAGRHWGAQYLQSLAEITRAQVTLEDARPSAAATEAEGGIEIARALPALDGKPVSKLRLHMYPEHLASLKEYGTEVITIVVIEGIIGILALVVGLRLWVVKPFEKITESLREHNAAAIEGLLRSESELGQIAKLVKEHFASQAALRRSEQAASRALDERVRLGRELHDGVIQSIYAAGMGLTAVRAEIHKRPESAEKKLDEIRTALNETIREVRSFIMRLELEKVDAKTFAQRIHDLVRGISFVKDPALEIVLNETETEQLPINVTTDALQQIRSTLQSAAQRGATRFRIELRAQAEGAEVLIIDNGAPDPNVRGRSVTQSDDAKSLLRKENCADGVQTTIAYVSR